MKKVDYNLYSEDNISQELITYAIADVVALKKILLTIFP
jgi:hypothetical protein